MPVQDDVRERQMLQLFNLHVPRDRRRSDVDAHLRLDGTDLPFELKSTTSGSVSTVRDFGADHIAKWRGKHWLFGFYDRSGTDLRYCCYGSPAAMAPWIEGKAAYVRPDQLLAGMAPEMLGQEHLTAILGAKDAYTLDDARALMKKHWSAARYLEAQDLPGGYSPDRTVQILRERCRYVIMRGSTLNNPHIEARYFVGWERIVEDHAARLRALVRDYLVSAAATDDATA
ncbi:MAG: hypothetical protein ACFCVF_02670 [Kineosporiaceae bacterium]